VQLLQARQRGEPRCRKVGGVDVEVREAREWPQRVRARVGQVREGGVEVAQLRQRREVVPHVLAQLHVMQRKPVLQRAGRSQLLKAARTRALPI
jgi:hypothetical protein